MAAKLGAEPWAVNSQSRGLMVIGYDTYHDPGLKVSVGAVVSTLNHNLTRFHSHATKHKNKEEIHRDISVSIEKAVQAYKRYNGGNLPTTVIVYRDAVGDGQLEEVIKVRVREPLLC